MTHIYTIRAAMLEPAGLNHASARLLAFIIPAKLDEWRRKRLDTQFEPFMKKIRRARAYLQDHRRIDEIEAATDMNVCRDLGGNIRSGRWFEIRDHMLVGEHGLAYIEVINRLAYDKSGYLQDTPEYRHARAIEQKINALFCRERVRAKWEAESRKKRQEAGARKRRKKPQSPRPA
ncbi:MAG: hypothetical protein AB7G06_09255 [Bdellovibrionales bacterium]